MYFSLRDYAKAFEYLTQCLAMAKEVGDESVIAAYGNLGNAYLAQGDFSKAIENHTDCHKRTSLSTAWR